MKKKIIFEILDYLKIFVLAVVIATLVNTLFFTFSQVQQRSMEKTLIQDDALLVSKVSYYFTDPKAGDIVVFLKGDDINMSFVGKVKRLYVDMFNKFKNIDNQDRLVKRVIGVEGDKIDIRDGKVYVNDILLVESYVNTDTYPSYDVPMPLVVPKGMVFVMGDNRAVSEDSRRFGCIYVDQIEGKAVFRLFPLKKFGGLY